MAAARATSSATSEASARIIVDAVSGRAAGFCDAPELEAAWTVATLLVRLLCPIFAPAARVVVAASWTIES